MIYTLHNNIFMICIQNMVGFGRNKSLVEKSFFTERFTPELIQTLNECGVKLGIHHPVLRLFGRMS